MKKFLKWLLVIVILGLIAMGIFIATMWDSISILKGTQNISGDISTIPQTQETPDSLTTGEHDWASWLGPNNDKRSTETGIITDWSNGLSKLWQVDYLCQGSNSASWSAPVIQGNRLVICGRDSVSDLVFCLDPNNGDLIWHNAYHADTKNNHGAGMRATPAIDSNRVYTFGRAGDLVCWDLENGTKIWHHNVTDEGGSEPTWGHSSSPLIWDGLVLVQGGGSARTIAYDKITGDMVWKSGNGVAGYTALVTMELRQKTILLSFHGSGLAAIDKQGNELWNIPWLTDYDVNATTPLIIDHERVFFSSGYKTGAAMLKVDASGADTLWYTTEMTAPHTDPYFIDGYIYGYTGDSFQNKGAFVCLDAKDGSLQWSTNDMGWGTCLWVDGHLICIDLKGNLFLMQPNPKEPVISGSLPKALGEDIRGPVWTMPIVANNKLYLRFKQRLTCYQITE